MPAPRRLGVPEAKNRRVLLDAAEELLLAEGWSAVTTRRVAERAGLKSQLVHYYFRSMDQLLLEVFQRRAEAGLAFQRQLLESDEPLTALWRLHTDPAVVRFTLAFVGLAGQRPVIRAAVADYAERFRAVLDAALARVLAEYESLPPAALAVLMTTSSRMAVLEHSLGIPERPTAAVDLIDREIARLEQLRRTGSPSTSGRRGELSNQRASTVSL